MTAYVSQWQPHRLTLPKQSTELPMRQIQFNEFALAVAQAHGFAPGWNYTNSVTRGEASPGTAALPLRKYWTRGSGNSTKWVKVVCTYTGANLTKAAFYFSEDNEASYVPMYDDTDINYVLTLAYTGADLTSTTWGNVP